MTEISSDYVKWLMSMNCVPHYFKEVNYQEVQTSRRRYIYTVTKTPSERSWAYYDQCQSSTTSTVVKAPLVRASLVKRRYIKYLALPF